MSARGWGRKMWAGDAGVAGDLVRVALLPGEALFRVAVSLRDRRYGPDGRGAVQAQVPVISVGNLSVGGTGKTPVAGWVVRELRERGAVPALVARGYGRDELLLHRRWSPGTPVIADPDRVAGVNTAAAEGATVAVLDDGFQHRRLARDLDLVLVAAEEGLPGALLPRGPFREPRSALRRAHGVVVTRKEALDARAEAVARAVEAAVAPGTPVARVRFEVADWRSLGGAVRDTAPQADSGRAVRVATAVARPESVVAAAEGLGWTVTGVDAFPDHHEFTSDDLAGILARAAGHPVAVTEKDAVKLEALPESGEADIRVLRQRMVWESGQARIEALLEQALEEAVR